MNTKEKALVLRRRGVSIRDIEKRLGIARSTLSYWFRNIQLAPAHRERLNKRWSKALVSARKKAVLWHQNQKEARVALAYKEAVGSLNKIKTHHLPTIEVALAMLYLGEGGKGSALALGNSDPQIIKFFLSAIEKLYGLRRVNLRYELHLRDDQNPISITRYWAKELQVPINRFSKPSLDPRTKGRATYPEYRGVCTVHCGNIAIQRKLVYISHLFCQNIIGDNKRA